MEFSDTLAGRKNIFWSQLLNKWWKITFLCLAQTDLSRKNLIQSNEKCIKCSINTYFLEILCRKLIDVFLGSKTKEPYGKVLFETLFSTGVCVSIESQTYDILLLLLEIPLPIKQLSSRLSENVAKISGKSLSEKQSEFCACCESYPWLQSSLTVILHNAMRRHEPKTSLEIQK